MPFKERTEGIGGKAHGKKKNEGGGVWLAEGEKKKSEKSQSGRHLPRLNAEFGCGDTHNKGA